MYILAAGIAFLTRSARLFEGWFKMCLDPESYGTPTHLYVKESYESIIKIRGESAEMSIIMRRRI